MRSRIVAVLRKESREFVRDPVYLGLAIAVPAIVMTLLGLGFVLDVKNLPVAFCDQDQSAISREYMYSFTNSEYFRLVRIARTTAELDRVLQTGEVRAGIVVPSDFSRDLRAGRTATVQVLVDGSFASRALIVTGYVAAADAQFSSGLTAGALERLGVSAAVPPISVDGRVWFNPTLETKNSIVPGLLVICLMFYPGLLAALVVVREKERGTIFNLYCAPISRWEIIVGKAAPYVAVAFIDYLLLFAMSVWVFDVRFVGDFFVLTIGAALYIVCCVGVGLVISVLCPTQVAAMLATFVGLMTPSIMFSGMMTPIASMEPSAQAISRLIPASYFMRMVRGVFLKRLGFDAYLPDFFRLALFGLVVYTIAIVAFRKKVA